MWLRPGRAVSRPGRDGDERRRRVAVTGIGVVAPGGTSRERFWSRVVAGDSAVRTITRFDPRTFRSQIAAECDFVTESAGVSTEVAARCDRFVLMALAAAREAAADASFDLSATDPYEVGVVLGSAVGASVRLEREYATVSDGGREWTVDSSRASGDLYTALVPASAATELALQFGAMGPALVVSTGCTSGIDAIGVAFETIIAGEATAVIAGASDAPITPITVASFDAIRATTPENETPRSASRPFDATRRGFVLGEGAAVLLLEELGSARARNVPVYCEITGYGARSNAFHMTGLRPDGAEMARAINAAMRQAGLSAESVDYISAHGSGTRQNDRHETAAFKTALGDVARRVPISSIKPVVGHSLGAIGALEMAACALAIRDGVVPPTANLTERDPECDLDYVPLVAREHTVRHALSVGSGFGGFQSAMVFSAASGSH
jgi:minimal PKS ketosynthase (KS/KS alpha)